MGPLKGFRIIELAGLAPVPYAGMILADFGAELIRVDRPGAPGMLPDATADALARGKQSVAINLKDPRGIELLLKLAESADALIEPFRPGVMEKLGLGPDVLAERNPRLVYARLTGYGQQGPYASMAGHDINYVAMSGVLHLLGRENDKPEPPINLLGDFAGGGMLCAMGVVMALLERERSGKGQVIDSAMVDGAASLASFIFGFQAQGYWKAERGTNLLDGAAHFYGTYETSDKRWLSVGAIEPQFYAALIEGMGLAADDLPAQMDQSTWPAMKEKFASVFGDRSRDEWCAVFDGTDACVAPILAIDEVASHPHSVERESFVAGVSGPPVPAPSPRLLRTPGRAGSKAPAIGQHTADILTDLGLSGDEQEALKADGVVC
ncbi:MAG TPA: CoA transferase [Deltaproteobacteria bacterium]|nr:CoA transferase [Candidatus Binatota bacterium]HIL14428.1 CoA transferase [Deltaproteobacteria bacterium]